MSKKTLEIFIETILKEKFSDQKTTQMVTPGELDDMKKWAQNEIGKMSASGVVNLIDILYPNGAAGFMFDARIASSKPMEQEPDTSEKPELPSFPLSQRSWANEIPEPVQKKSGPPPLPKKKVGPPPLPKRSGPPPLPKRNGPPPLPKRKLPPFPPSR